MMELQSYIAVQKPEGVYNCGVLVVCLLPVYGIPF